MAVIPTDRNLMNPMGDLTVAVAIGAIPGWEVFRKFGDNDSVVGTGTLQDIWPLGTPRVLPAAAGVVSVVSDDATDDVGNTGAQILRVQGLDEDYLEIQEDVNMDGATPAVTTAEFLRVNRAFVLTAGTAQHNNGNITCSIGGAAQAYIQALQGQTQQAMYTVPANKTYIQTRYAIGVGRMAGSSDCHFQGEIQAFGTNSWLTQSNVYLFSGQSYTAQGGAVLLPPKTELRIQTESSSATQAFGISAGFLIDNDVGI